jgi:hypothetical protein
LTAIFNQWTKSPAQIRSEAKSSLRYVVFDAETRAIGYTALLREDWASLMAVGGDKRLLKEARQAAVKRFKLSKHMNDSLGVDFFVSHNWCDENAPHRWTALVKLSDLFHQRYACGSFKSEHIIFQLKSLPPPPPALYIYICVFVCVRFGRLPRFWLDRFCIDQSKQEDIAAKTAFLPATIMRFVSEGSYYLFSCFEDPPRIYMLNKQINKYSCNFVVVLQSPQYMGCSAPPCSLPSLWCIMEFFTLCTLAPAHDPTTNLIWIPLFKSTPVPPKLDLLHGRVYCFCDEVHIILNNITKKCVIF